MKQYIIMAANYVHFFKNPNFFLNFFHFFQIFSRVGIFAFD